MTRKQTNTIKTKPEPVHYQDISTLTKENQKIIKRMTKYLYTFPLSPEEISQIRKDLIGMAYEAESRGESLPDVLGKSPREFCNDLIYAIGGIRSPGGRKLLVIAAAYFQIIGFIGIFFALIAYVLVFRSFSVEEYSMLIFTTISLVESLIFYIAGTRALRYCNNTQKAGLALRWGIGLLILTFLFYVIPLPGNDSNLLINLPEYIYILLSVIFFIINFAFPILYILGAWRNRPGKQD